MVFYHLSEGRTLSLIETEFPQTPHLLYLFLFQQHYNGIRSLKTFLGVPYIYKECHRGYLKREEHFCQNPCNLCFDPACPSHYLDAVVCPDCNRSCSLGFDDRAKGHFTHKFSLRDCLKYIGPYLPRLSLAEREKFLRWHNEASQGVFNFEKQSVYYYQNDINILKEACLKFRDEFIGETSVDPFSCVTITSACMSVPH